MRSIFPGYYRPTEDQFKQLWEQATFVFDANVLLDLYRYPAAARDDLLAVLEQLKDRIWIPYQVAAEYQRNRIGVLQDVRKKVESLRRTAIESQSKINDELVKLEMSKRSGIDVQKYSDKFKGLVAELDAAVTKALEHHPIVSLDDKIRERIDQLFEGKVGEPPKTQGEIDALCQEGRKRYDNRVPPGFEDEKEKAEQVASTNGLVYPRAYGDYIFWTQIIQHADTNSIEHLVLVTSDRKKDWWEIVEGKTLGPLPELVHEIRRKSKVRNFWMYEVSGFLNYAKQHVRPSVKETSISEVQEIESVRPAVDTSPRESRNFEEYERQRWQDRSSEESRAEDEVVFAVAEWVQQRDPGSALSIIGGFPDLIAQTALTRRVEGFAVKALGTAMSGALVLTALQIARKGMVEILKNNLTHFTAVLVLDDRFVRGSHAYLREVVDRLRTVIRDYPRITFVIGEIRAGTFRPLYESHRE